MHPRGKTSWCRKPMHWMMSSRDEEVKEVEGSPFCSHPNDLAWEYSPFQTYNSRIIYDTSFCCLFFEEDRSAFSLTGTQAACPSCVCFTFRPAGPPRGGATAPQRGHPTCPRQLPSTLSVSPGTHGSHTRHFCPAVLAMPGLQPCSGHSST